MFVDAAAMVAVLSLEAEAERCLNAISAASAPFTSPIAVWEATLSLARPNKLSLPLAASQQLVMRFLDERGIDLRDLPPPPEAAALSLEAAQRFGSGKRRLNLADCFHYACARHHNVPILSTDGEFRLTDLATVP